MDAIEKTLGKIYVQNTQTLTTMGSSKTEQELTEEEKLEVQRLKKRDGEVRAHEEAHKRAAGVLAKGAPNYKYEIGPDGRRYAVSGHVKIDTAPENNPDKTISKADKIKSAALAPLDPSSQDRKVAQSALRMAAKAKQEKLSKDELEEVSQEDPDSVKETKVNKSTKNIDSEINNSYDETGKVERHHIKGEIVDKTL